MFILWKREFKWILSIILFVFLYYVFDIDIAMKRSYCSTLMSMITKYFNRH